MPCTRHPASIPLILLWVLSGATCTWLQTFFGIFFWVEKWSDWSVLVPFWVVSSVTGAMLKREGRQAAGTSERWVQHRAEFLGPSGTPSRAPPTALGLAAGSRMQHNEQLFLGQLPALCQVYSHLGYNCHHIFNPQQALIKIEFK